MTVLDGRNGMPSFGMPVNGHMEFFSVYLSDQKIADLVNYVRGHFGDKSKEKVTVSQKASLPHLEAALSHGIFIDAIRPRRSGCYPVTCSRR
jgi:hypothetical protein